MKKLHYHDVESAFNKMTLRERVILFAALIICITSISYFWIVDPAMIKLAKSEQQLQKIQKQEKDLNNEIAQIKLRLQQDPLQEVNNQIAFSQATLNQLDKQLDDKLVKFIHAQKMPIALTKVLSKSPGVNISGLRSLPVKVFNARQDKSESSTEENLFYQHTLEITLLGDYNAIYQYLLNLETLQEKFYWYSLDYRVSKYPLAEVTLQIYTLSNQQDLVSG